MRACRRRAAKKRNVTPDGEPPETSAALRTENRRRSRLLAEAQEQIPEAKVSTLSIYDAKANWKRNTRACLPKLLKKWREKKEGQRNVTDWEAEANRLKEEVHRLSKQLKDLARPNYSMAISIDTGANGYVARHLNGHEWAQGKTPMEAFGELVFSHANVRTVTVESVEFGY